MQKRASRWNALVGEEESFDDVRGTEHPLRSGKRSGASGFQFHERMRAIEFIKWSGS